ncbi:AmmeMemoRadiSam system protein A [uncultured Amphritea sp.]|uniref:AmmeMemoRadiSam system protein A n=1 Tax=uncultured Amphritea sp. TaxID=981605 RepID=UPI002604214F|nr:AmmeMemoRadiSam system protein A [uncultured Amphritea sp.]
MHSIERYSATEQQLLLHLARDTVARGLAGQEPQRPSAENIPAWLEKSRACFVTLKLDGRLRGCIGNLEANSSLVDAVLRNSYLAAFRDQRFDPVSAAELAKLQYEISVLTPMVPLPVSSEADLLAKIRPGIDGLLFEAEGHRSTFLPSVWEQLNQPKNFLNQLRQKAGLAADYWSDDVKCWIYQAIKIGEDESDSG